MVKQIQNTIHKVTAFTAILAVVLLNFSAVVQCGQMLIHDDCCHITKTIKPCCLKSTKVTLNERFTSSCGCTMKEAQQPADMYTDVISGYHKNLSHASIDIENASSEIFQSQNNFITAYYSPPIISAGSIYLTNMNLRI